MSPNSSLLATDWSEPSANALRALIALDNLPEKIIITHVIDAKVTKGRNESAIKVLKKKAPGGYKFGDYRRMGLPLEILVGAGGCTDDPCRVAALSRSLTSHPEREVIGLPVDYLSIVCFRQIDIDALPEQLPSEQFNKGDSQQRKQQADVYKKLENQGAWFERMGKFK